MSREWFFFLKKKYHSIWLFSCTDILGLGIATLFIGLCVRSAVSFSVTIGTGFNLKERIFITLTWLSKATVQVLYSLYYTCKLYFIYIKLEKKLLEFPYIVEFVGLSFCWKDFKLILIYYNGWMFQQFLRV